MICLHPLKTLSHSGLDHISGGRDGLKYAPFGCSNNVRRTALALSELSLSEQLVGY